LPFPIVSQALKLDNAAIAAAAMMNFLIMLSLPSDSEQAAQYAVRIVALC
jgi:hypothetical protein